MNSGDTPSGLSLSTQQEFETISVQDDADSTPMISIGLAVFNGEKYLEEAIESLLSQTYNDFELIISDNASTDQTPEICKKYAQIDKRVRYFRNKTNIGGANNENQTFRLSRGKYFRWAAHDDRCAPTLLEKCVEVLESDEGIVLCHTGITAIDENGDVIGQDMHGEGQASSPYQRFRQLASREHKCEATYGLIRSSVLGKTELEKNYTGSDRTLLCELGLYGKFYQIPEYLFFKRFHPQNMFLDWRGRMAWFDPSIAEKGKITFPTWLEFADYLKTIHKVPLSVKDKVSCYLFMAYWAITNLGRLLKDIAVAIYMFLHSKSWRVRKYSDSQNWS